MSRMNKEAMTVLELQLTEASFYLCRQWNLCPLWFCCFIPHAVMNEASGAGVVSPLKPRPIAIQPNSGDSRPPLRKASNLTARGIVWWRAEAASLYRKAKLVGRKLYPALHK